MSHQNLQIVERLLPFLVEKDELCRVNQLISADVLSHMDHYTAHGLQVWMQWVHFINSRRRVTHLETQLECMTIDADERVTVSGRWRAERRGKTVISEPISATYRIHNDLIVEIWTRRTNYALIFGPLMRSRCGLALVLLYFSVWRLFHPAPISTT
jgi:hypothetical protein